MVLSNGIRGTLVSVNSVKDVTLGPVGIVAHEESVGKFFNFT